MKVAILGAGAAGSAMAGLAASREHDVTLWSPRGGGTRHLGNRLKTRGLLEGSWPLRIAADLGRALDGAEVVLVALPGHVLPHLLHRMAATLVGEPAVLLTPPGALAPLLLHALAQSRGLSLPVAALPVPPVAARRDGDGAIDITAIRPRIWAGGLPAAARRLLAETLVDLFGLPVEPLADVLAAGLAEPTALIGAARMLAPATVPHGVARLLLGLSAERDALAAACGRGALPGMAEMVMEQGGLPETLPPLPELGAGLAFLEALGRATGHPVPLIAAALQLLEGATGESFSPHPVMKDLDAAFLAKVLGP
jgi:opine dehydrogenase